MKTYLFIIVITISLLQTSYSQLVFSDSFDGDVTSTNPTNSDPNSLYETRQTGTKSDYTHGGSSGGGGAFINMPAAGVLANQSVLLLRTQGAQANNAFAKINNNFSDALSGKIYKIKFSGYIATAGDHGDDHWGSFLITDNPTVTNPNSDQTDYAMLFRERNTNNVTIWKDGLGSTKTILKNGNASPFNANNLFTIEITIDEMNGTANTIINSNLPTEKILSTETIGFDNNTDRYFVFRANKAARSNSGLVDFRFEDFSITIIPEPNALFPFLAFIGTLSILKKRFNY